MNKKELNKLLKKYDYNELTTLLIENYINKNNNLLNINNIFELINYLEMLIPNKDKYGIFFTPLKIIQQMVDNINFNKDSKILDCSCGYSSFLIYIIQIYKQKFNKSISDILKENIFGIDLLSNNIEISKKLIYILAKEYDEEVNENDFNFIEYDFLKYETNIKFDWIIGNPPYIKIQDLDIDYRNWINKKYTTCSLGNFNIYYAFYEKAYSLLNDDGELIFITPNSFYYNDSSKLLRNFLKSKIYKIFDFKSQKVFNVGSYNCIIWINKKENNLIYYETNNEIKYINYNQLTNSKWNFLTINEQNNIYNIENAGIKLKDLFKISYGLATLKDEFYIINDLNLIDNKFYNKDGFLIEKELVKPLVKPSEFNNKLLIIFPYYYNKKWICFNEEDLINKYPEFYKYALFNKTKLLNRDCGNKQYEEFFSFGRKQGLNNEGIKWITCKYNNYPNFILDKDENYFITGYGLYLKNEYYDKIDYINKILNSDIMNYYIQKTSSYIANDYYCYEKNKIENFSILFSNLNISELDNTLINKLYNIN